jgi:hypothetical protein
MQIKTTISYHLTPVRMTIIKKTKNKTKKTINAAEDTEQELSYSVGGNVN